MSRCGCKGAEKFGTKAEVKNLNSFRFLKQALDYEIARQVALIESGGRVVQETRLYNPDTGETVGMRSKEDAHDYRYFPEPDLVPLRISETWLARSAGRHAGAARAQARALRRGVRAARIRRPGADRRPRAISEYFETAAQRFGRSEDGRQLGDGRSDGRC